MRRLAQLRTTLLPGMVLAVRVRWKLGREGRGLLEEGEEDW